MLYLAAFVVSYVFIFLKAAQQLNVQHDQYLLVIPTSMLMAACETWIVFKVAHQGWGWIVLAIGLGAGLGAVTAMWAHKHVRRLFGA